MEGGKNIMFFLDLCGYILSKAYDKRGNLSPFMAFTYTPDLDITHQTLKDIKRNYLTVTQGYLH